MSVIYLVLPLSMLLVLAAVLAYAWATRGGQLDDLETPAVRMLEDSEGAAGAAGQRQVDGDGQFK